MSRQSIVVGRKVRIACAECHAMLRIEAVELAGEWATLLIAADHDISVIHNHEDGQT